MTRKNSKVFSIFICYGLEKLTFRLIISSSAPFDGLDEELSSGNSWWGYSPSQYPCLNSNSLYSAGLLPGNTVTFSDPGGTAETVTLANAETATLYCYTPYVGPASLTGYSGSYNFVYYFQLWFGSTQASIPYSWIVQSQNAYSNSAYSQPFTNSSVATVAPGQDVYMQVQARNVGYDNWTQGTTNLGTSNPEDRSSVFYNSTWMSSNRPTTISESSVAPGNVGTFDFVLHSPSTTGTYYEYFNLVEDGVTWFNNPGLYYKIHVVAPVTSSSGATILNGGQSLSINKYLLSPDTQSSLDFQANGNITLYSNFKPSWSTNTSGSGGSTLIMQTDGNLVEYNSAGQAVWSSGTNNNPGAYLALQTDGNMVIYNSSGSPIWATGTQQNPNHLDYVNTTASEGSILFGGQSMQTPSRQFTLIMQTDGNLVEYNNTTGQALWASGTWNNPGAYLALQTDGNLVIYTSANKPIWASNIFGQNTELNLDNNGLLTIGTTNTLLLPGQTIQPGQQIQTPNRQFTLIMQTDGNLVEYTNSGQPIWASNTSNNPGAYAIMQTDGNLVIYGSNGSALWNSGTYNNPGAYLALQTDGNVVVYSHSNKAIYATFS